MPEQREIPIRMSPDSIDEGDIPRREDVDVELAEKRKRRVFREEGWFYRVRIAAVCICAFIALSVVCIYVWHLVLPETWCWLNEARLARIENAASMIVVGVIGTLSASYFLKR